MLFCPHRMGRPRGFSRNAVLENVIPVFWKNGFADTSVQELEQVTGVNKSGLYSEFKDKDDLFLASLKYYIETSGVEKILLQKPLGLKNIEALLLFRKSGEGPRGCFLVNSTREISILPAKAKSLINSHFEYILSLVIKNIEAYGVSSNASQLAQVILTFNAGLCLEQNIPNHEPHEKIKLLLKLVRELR